MQLVVIHFNEGADPPTFPVSLRSRHRRLFNEINSELAVIQRDQKDLLEKVEDWVLMKELKARFEGKPTPASKKQSIQILLSWKRRSHRL